MTSTSEQTIDATDQSHSRPNDDCSKKIMDYLTSIPQLPKGDLQNHLEKIMGVISKNPVIISSVSKKKKRKKKKVIDPNAPKKPKRSQNAFFWWLNADGKRKELKAKLADEGIVDAKTSAITKKGGELWRAMSDHDKAPFKEQHKAGAIAWEKAMVIYEEAMASYKCSAADEVAAADECSADECSAAVSADDVVVAGSTDDVAVAGSTDDVAVADSAKCSANEVAVVADSDDKNSTKKTKKKNKHKKDKKKKDKKDKKKKNKDKKKKKKKNKPTNDEPELQHSDYKSDY